MEARLTSLEELEAARAQYGDAARFLLADQTAGIRQFGSLADYLEVDGGYERAVESYLGDLLQHVLVADHDEAARGLALVREHNAGRCGFLVVGAAAHAGWPEPAPPVEGLVPMASVIRITGGHANLIRHAIGHAWIATSYIAAVEASRLTDLPVVTPDGDVLRGSHLVYGGVREEARGILSTKREVKELRDRAVAIRSDLLRLEGRADEAAAAIDRLTQEITRLVGEAHAQEKAIVGFEALVANALENRERLARKAEVLATESARAQEERRTLEGREARGARVGRPPGRRSRWRPTSGSRSRSASSRTPAKPPRSSAAASPTHAPRTPASSSGPPRCSPRSRGRRT